jgi:hypothetical protein
LIIEYAEQVEYISEIRIEYARSSNTWDRYYFNIGLKTGKYLHIFLGRDFDWEILYNNNTSSSKKEQVDQDRNKSLRVITKLRNKIIDLIPVENINSIMLELD